MKTYRHAEEGYFSNSARLCAKDSDALARFEALVQSQKPADSPWTPVTDYSAEERDKVEAPHAAVIASLLPCDDADVLDYGCGPDQHLVRNLRAVAPPMVAVRGYDPQIAASECWLQHSAYDLVICREVLEHLTIRQLARTVRELCALSSGFVYVTTRFANDPDHLLDVDTSDDLDPTHITMLNQDFLRVLFVLEGFTRRADLEQKLDWMQKGRVLVYERA